MAQKPNRKKDTRPNRDAIRSSTRGASTGPKPSALTLGEDLEYRFARLQIFAGFLVRRGCPIYTISALDRATDLDVLAFRYVEPFHRETIIAECKSGGTPPLDRIFWLSGVSRYMRARQAFLVRKGTKWNIKDFAKECRVQIFDLTRVAELESALKIAPDDWPGISDKTFFEANITSWNQHLAADPRFWELYQTLTSEVRFDDAFVGVNYLLSQLRQLTRQWNKLPNHAYFRYLLSESITQLGVFLMHIAETSFDLGIDDRRGFVTKGLTYGNLEPQYADRILNSAYNMTRQAVQHYTHKLIDIDKSLFSMPSPPNTDSIVELVNDLVATYPHSLSFPQICDLIVFERFTKCKEAKGWLRRIFPNSDLPARVDVVRRFIGMLVSIEACPQVVLDVVFANGTPSSSSPESMRPVGATDARSTQTGSPGNIATTSGRMPEPIVTATPAPNRRPEQENLDLSIGTKGYSG